MDLTNVDFYDGYKKIEGPPEDQEAYFLMVNRHDSGKWDYTLRTGVTPGRRFGVEVARFNPHATNLNGMICIVRAIEEHT